MPKLYIVATPIGNLEDMTFRAVKTLKGVDLILCEDTRVTKKLLDRYEIEKPTMAYHQRSKLSKTDKIISEMESGKDLALVTDAGTPGISDPGNELVEKTIEHFGDSVEIIPIPGSSAVTALVSVAGINLSKFVFLGFPPNKKGRQTFFKKVLAACYPVVYYESPYRFLKNVELLKNLSGDERLQMIVGRELTKIHEEVVRGSTEEILEHYENNPGKVKGEFVIIINRKEKK